MSEKNETQTEKETVKGWIEKMVARRNQLSNDGL